RKSRLEPLDLPGDLVEPEARPRDDGDAGRIVAAVLEAVERGGEGREGLLPADVSDGGPPPRAPLDEAAALPPPSAGPLRAVSGAAAKRRAWTSRTMRSKISGLRRSSRWSSPCRRATNSSTDSEK